MEKEVEEDANPFDESNSNDSILFRDEEGEHVLRGASFTKLIECVTSAEKLGKDFINSNLSHKSVKSSLQIFGVQRDHLANVFFILYCLSIVELYHPPVPSAPPPPHPDFYLPDLVHQDSTGARSHQKLGIDLYCTK